jgi:dTDP-4-amino-4,6-dideoxygalactose transaminase
MILCASLCFPEDSLNTIFEEIKQVHLQPFYMENFGKGTVDMPVAETVLNQVLCLPMHYDVTK